MQYIFVEYLTVYSWFFSVVPQVLWRNIPKNVYFIERSEAAFFLIIFTARVLSIQVEKLDFKADDIIDNNGNVIWMRVFFEDMAEVVHLLNNESVLKKFIDEEVSSVTLATYLQKQCLPGLHVLDANSLWRAIYVVQVFLHKIDQCNLDFERTLILLRPRLWQDEIFSYVKAHHAVVAKSAFGKTALWSQTTRIARLMVALETRKLSKKMKHLLNLRRKKATTNSSSLNYLVAGEFWGDLNLDQPAFYSDFFFWQQSSLPSRNLIAIFKSAGSRALTEAYWNALNKHGIQAVALNHQANKYITGNVYDTSPHLTPKIWLKFFSAFCAYHKKRRWLLKEIAQFSYEEDYWYHLFRHHNIKVYTTWFKYNSEHCIIAKAAERVGGIMTVYQRAYEGLSCMQLTLAVDIYFAFAKSGAQVEALSNSHIRYHVTTGLLSDHRNDLVSADAEKMRKHLKTNGARHIVAFFDENTIDDGRWFSGHESMQTDYAFWLEKVLSCPDFGLVLKPKRSSNLRQRLGDIAVLLDQALSTGRCHLYGEETQGYITPVQAAKSADIAVHSSLYATTAAMEAALAGVPSVIKFDGYNKHPLYQVAKGKFIFDEWAHLWQACQDYWQPTGREVCLQSWAPVIDELDSFRDGRAAERMGNYLHWLIEGFEQGMDRDVVMADAAERYGKRWGWDYVQEVTPGYVSPFSANRN